MHKVLEHHTAGDPQRPEVVWTHLGISVIQDALAESDLIVCEHVIRDLLHQEGYRRRKIQKYKDIGEHPDRDAQFHNVARIRQEYLQAGDPILSIDTKKKEFLGLLCRPGTTWMRRELLAWDHDFPSLATGKVIPYGLYDLAINTGYVNLGTSADTSEFACESIYWWYAEHGQQLYPNAKRLCLLADGGGSNAANRYLFKQELQQLAQRTGLQIRMTHYPPYCSKYNPIERRLFCHLSRSMSGLLLDSVQTVRQLLETTCTRGGLSVLANVMDRVFETGRTYDKDFKENMRIVFDDYLPKWNYTALPRAA